MKLLNEDVSRETSKYLGLILKWNKKINLISKRDVNSVFSRHIQDSAQLYNLITDKNARIVDLGSGGGFPGVVLSIMGCSKIHLVELDERKCVFLREVKRQLSLSCAIVNKDIKLLNDRYDVCVSRGLGTLSLLLGFAINLLNSDGYCLFLKGKSVDVEIDDAKQFFNFDVKKHPSITDQNGVVLEVRNLKLKLNE